MTLDTLKKSVYSPYSTTNKKNEWCIVIGKSNTAYPGVRIENISFPLTISSLHGAICSCLGNGDQPVAYYKESEEMELEPYLREEYALNILSAFPETAVWYDPLLPLTTDTDKALDKLIGQAVIPHSDFPVSALLETPEGYIAGVNVELNSWALGLCAERVAIFRAVSHGFSEFTKILINAPKGDFSSPCGACRQVMMEWMPGGKVELHHGDESISTHNVTDLLPHSFSTSKLNR